MKKSVMLVWLILSMFLSISCWAEEPALRARKLVENLWKRGDATLTISQIIPTEKGEWTKVFVFFIGDYKQYNPAMDWLRKRKIDFSSFSGLNWEDKRIKEESLLNEELFATVIIGPDDKIWWVQSGVPLAITVADNIGELSNTIRADCKAIAFFDSSPEIWCGNKAYYSPKTSSNARETEEEWGYCEDKTGNDTFDPSQGQFPLNGTGWYHYPGSSYHYPNSGWFKGDDTYALDLNKGTYSYSDCGQAVLAIANGVVKEVSTSSGWVLIEHPYSVTVKGISYDRLYSGQGHMRNIRVSVGQQVTKGQQIGEVYNLGGNYSCHLHWVVYVGTYLSSTNNRMLYSFNPATLGGSFSSFNYDGKIFDNFVDDKNSSGNYIFTRSGDTSDWFTTSTYGIMNQMSYTKTSLGNNKATWLWNDGVPQAGTYRFYAFIPRYYGTSTKVPYKFYGSDSASVLKGSATINQYIYYDYWLNMKSLYLAQGEKIKVELTDNTGESGKYIGADIIRRFKKTDVRMNQ